MKKITITASKTYDVLTGSGLLPRAGAYIRQALGEKVRKICVVTDSNVAPLYSDALISSLEESGFVAVKFVFAAGEASKTCGRCQISWNFWHSGS